MANNSQQKSVAQIVGEWPSRKELAEDISASVMTVHHMVSRRKVPHKYRWKMAQAALRRGISVTVEQIDNATGVHTSQNGNAPAAYQPPSKQTEGDAA